MTKEDLIVLVQQIIDVNGKKESEIDLLIDAFRRNVPHPSAADLIYHQDLSADEIVEKALSHKAIQL